MKPIKNLIQFVTVFLSSAACISCQPSSVLPVAEDITQEVFVSPIAGEAMVSPSIAPTEEAEAYSEQDYEAVQKIMDEIMPYYRETIKIIDHGDFDAYGIELEDENGAVYLEILDDKYNTVEAVREMAESAFTKSYVKEHYSYAFDTDTPKYKEIGGQLCIHPMDAPMPFMNPEVIKIEGMSDAEIIVIMQEENDAGISNITVTIKKEEERWRIDSIER